MFTDLATIGTISTLAPLAVSWLFKIFICVAIWFVGRKLSEIIVNMFEKTASRSGLDVSVTGFLKVLISWGCSVILVMIILNYLNIASATIVTVLGSCGLAIAMSLQGSLANFAGSVVLLVTKPFRVGDYIICGLGEGTVKFIGLIYTSLETIDKKEVHIPNGALANSNITNASSNPLRGVSVKVGISYSADIKKAKDVMKKVVLESPYTEPETDVNVFVAELADSAVVLEARSTVSNANYWPQVWYCNETIKNSFDAEGISIPFNQLDVHLSNQ